MPGNWEDAEIFAQIMLDPYGSGDRDIEYFAFNLHYDWRENARIPPFDRWGIIRLRYGRRRAREMYWNPRILEDELPLGDLPGYPYPDQSYNNYMGWNPPKFKLQVD